MHVRTITFKEIESWLIKGGRLTDKAYVKYVSQAKSKGKTVLPNGGAK